MIHGVHLAPRRCRREEVVLALARLGPGDALLELVRAGLLDAEPVVLEGLLLVLDEGDPVVLLAAGDAVGLGEDT